MTEHAQEINQLREQAAGLQDESAHHMRRAAIGHGKYRAEHIGCAARFDHEANVMLLAADLLEIHDATGLSLDNWESATDVIERLTGSVIRKNGV